MEVCLEEQPSQHFVIVLNIAFIQLMRQPINGTTEVVCFFEPKEYKYD